MKKIKIDVFKMDNGDIVLAESNGNYFVQTTEGIMVYTEEEIRETYAEGSHLIVATKIGNNLKKNDKGGEEKFFCANEEVNFDRCSKQCETCTWAEKKDK